jgi:prevent-host-death family protein
VLAEQEPAALAPSDAGLSGEQSSDARELDQLGHPRHVLRMTRVVNIAAAKAHLPELVERAANGETVILARAGKPRAKIVALDDKPPKKRVPGKGKGRFRLKKGFDEPLPEEVLALFEGRST